MVHGNTWKSGDQYPCYTKRTSKFAKRNTPGLTAGHGVTMLPCLIRAALPKALWRWCFEMWEKRYGWANDRLHLKHENPNHEFLFFFALEDENWLTAQAKHKWLHLSHLALKTSISNLSTLRGGQSTGCLCLLLGNMMGNYLFCIHTQILSSTQHFVSSRSLHLDFHPWSDYGTLHYKCTSAWLGQMPLVLAPPGASVLGWLFKFVI